MSQRIGLISAFDAFAADLANSIRMMIARAINDIIKIFWVFFIYPRFNEFGPCPIPTGRYK